MPIQSLPTFAAIPQSVYTITLGGARFRVRLTWRERVAAWYLDVETQDGTKIASGRRLTARGDPLGGLLPDGRPDGRFLVRAVNLTAREQLGADALLLFCPAADLPAEVVPDPGYRVVPG